MFIHSFDAFCDDLKCKIFVKNEKTESQKYVSKDLTGSVGVFTIRTHILRRMHDTNGSNMVKPRNLSRYIAELITVPDRSELFQFYWPGIWSTKIDILFSPAFLRCIDLVPTVSGI